MAIARQDDSGTAVRTRALAGGSGFGHPHSRAMAVSWYSGNSSFKRLIVEIDSLCEELLQAKDVSA